MILMVIMFVVMIYLFLVMMMSMLIMMTNKSMFVFSLKTSIVNFYSDLEILISVWNLLFLLMVLLISLSVVIFSFSYMNSYSVSNFIFLYVSFVVSMLWLILNNNFYWMMFGWDGLGVVSFMLIVFYMNHESIKNGLFTLFQNRIGDLFFVMFLLGALNLNLSLNLILKSGLLFLVLGASVKSAQFPFNSWLLSAMSAPTPISSLVHSSTLVVAGVFILLQFSYCLSDVLEILKFISLMTLILSSFGLLNEFDMKKLIAYSTLSHVSLMMYMLSFKLYKIVYFHLNIHAMFKSLMFMCFGFVMLSSYHGQDKRLVSVLVLNPMIKMVYYFSCLCLAGLPFLSGFFSKDFMIEKMMENSIYYLNVLLLILFLSISIFYSLKLMNLNQNMFTVSFSDKSFLGMFSVFMMLMVMILFINIYLSLVFSLSLETVSMKLFIYLLIFMFFCASILSNWNFKMNMYESTKNFMEIWFLNFYILDKFVYSTINYFFISISGLNNMKLFLLMNWWVLIIFIVLF